MLDFSPIWAKIFHTIEGPLVGGSKGTARGLSALADWGIVFLWICKIYKLNVFQQPLHR